jgi:hypothetical protein
MIWRRLWKLPLRLTKRLHNHHCRQVPIPVPFLPQDFSAVSNNNMYCWVCHTIVQESVQTSPPARKRRRVTCPPSAAPAPGDRSHRPLLLPVQPPLVKYQNGALGVLSEPLLLRVCSFLSAEDLSSVSMCSRALKGMANEGLLWRRLYASRWTAMRDGEHNLVEEESGWKVGHRCYN